MIRTYLICILWIFVSTSCKTIYVTPDLPVHASLVCKTLLADKVAFYFDSELREEDTKLAEVERKTVAPPFIDRLEKSGCFNQVKWDVPKQELKNFDRIIKLSNNYPTSPAKIIGHTLWVMVSASTLFLIPYHGTFSQDLIFEDSKTGFKKTYPIEYSMSLHLFYFFNYNNISMNETEITKIYDDFIVELREQK